MLAVLVIALLTSPATPAGKAAGASEQRHGRIDAIVLDVGIADREAIAEALRARVGARAVGSSDKARRPRADERFAYLEVTQSDTSVTIRVLLSDGRAYNRSIDAVGTARAREIASIVGNLVAGIEEDVVAADEESVPVPERLQPAPARPQPPAPVVRAPAALPRWTISAAGLAIVGVGPPAPMGLAGAGARVGFAHRWARGLTLGASVRAAGMPRRDHALTRVRIAGEIGHLLRRGRFELTTTFAVTVEPWFVTRGGALASGTRRPASALLGGAIRVAPGVALPLPRGAALRIAPFVELAGSAIPSASGGVARVREDLVDGTRDLFRVGGLELSAGLELGVWLPARW